MSLSDSLKNKKFDKRMLEWNLKNGVVTQSEYDQYISSLDDGSAKCENLHFEDSSDEPSNDNVDSHQTNGASTMQGFQH